MTELRHHVAAFYRFTPLEGLEDLRRRVLELAAAQELIGTILLATEGINGTLASKNRAQLALFFESLSTEPGLAELPIKWSTAEHAPFDRLRVKHKKEIVTFGRPVEAPRREGTYVPPTKWNELLEEAGLVLVDARNDYEVRLGAFENAIDPGTSDFRELPRWIEENLDPRRDRKIAMYCTGGIRCEKATALLRELGFPGVYHLEGGILAYLEQVPRSESRFHGACFVFDQRVSLEHGLQTGRHQICSTCGAPSELLAECASCRSTTP